MSDASSKRQTNQRNQTSQKNRQSYNGETALSAREEEQIVVPAVAKCLMRGGTAKDFSEVKLPKVRDQQA